MARKLEILVFALALATCGGLTTSTASAGELTSDGSVKLSWTESPTTFTAFGTKVECHSSSSTFPFIPSWIFEFKPVYSNCVSQIGETKLPATVTMNSCFFIFYIGWTQFSDYEVTTRVFCGITGDAIEFHSYTSATHGSTVCTLKVREQTGLEGASIENAANGDLLLKGPTTGIRAEKTGILCGGTATTFEAAWDLNALISGTNGEGQPTDVSVTD